MNVLCTVDPAGGSREKQQPTANCAQSSSAYAFTTVWLLAPTSTTNYGHTRKHRSINQQLKKRKYSHSHGRTRQKQTFGGHLRSYIEQPISTSAFPTKANDIPMVPLTQELSLCQDFPEVPKCTLQTSRCLIYTQLQKFSDPSFLTVQAPRTCLWLPPNARPVLFFSSHHVRNPQGLKTLL